MRAKLFPAPSAFDPQCDITTGLSRTQRVGVVTIGDLDPDVVYTGGDRIGVPRVAVVLQGQGEIYQVRARRGRGAHRELGDEGERANRVCRRTLRLGMGLKVL